MTLQEQINDLEHRIVYEARTIEAAARMIDQRDALIARRDGRPEPLPTVGRIARRGTHGPSKQRSKDYERGYDAGYHAGIRAKFEPPCDHEGIGYPWCPQCGPKTRQAMYERTGDASWLKEAVR